MGIKDHVKFLWNVYQSCKTEGATIEMIEGRIKEVVKSHYEDLSKPDQRSFDNAKSRFMKELRELYRMKEGKGLGKSFINSW